jgi:AraC-like DNA-binding protein
MGPVAALLDSRAALATLRRTMPDGSGAVLACRSPAALIRAVTTRVIDGLVLGIRAASRLDLASLRTQFPAVPLFIYGPIRSDGAGLVLDYYEGLGASAVLVEGVDDAAVGDLIARGTITARRRAELAGLPRVLRLTEPIQLEAFRAIERQAGTPTTTGTLAVTLRVSREHLSRQFGAGGAPNLKRVIDLIQVLTARDLLQNPGYSLVLTAHALGYSTPSHLGAVTRRVLGVPLRDLSRLPNAELVRRFVAVGARSRR